MRTSRYILVGLILLCLARTALGQSETPTPTITETPTPTETGTPTITATPAATLTPTAACGTYTGVVNTLADHDDGCCDGMDCTLREALLYENGTTITFSVAGTITLATAIVIPNGVTVNGGGGITIDLTGGGILTWDGAAAGTSSFTGMTVENATGSAVFFSATECGTFTDMTFINNSGQDGGGGGAIFDGSSNGGCTITNCTFINNLDAAPGVGGIGGGAIYLGGGALPNTITGSLFDHNHTQVGGSPGGAIFNGSGGNVIVSLSVFTNNTATGVGGAIRDGGFASLSLTNCTFDSNHSDLEGGALDTGNTLGGSIIGCTFSNNTSDLDASAWWDGGGTWTVYNDTFSGNSALGASLPEALVLTSSGYNITYVTFDANSGVNGTAGTIWGGPLVVLDSCIVNGGLPQNCDPMALPSSSGFNIESGTDCAFASADDLQSTDPLLLPLQNNGGPTDTEAFCWAAATPVPTCGASSPALDSAKDEICPGTDQRGISRPQGPRCDRGAYEAGLLPTNTPTITHTPTETPTPTPTDTPTASPTRTPTVLAPTITPTETPPGICVGETPTPHTHCATVTPIRKHCVTVTPLPSGTATATRTPSSTPSPTVPVCPYTFRDNTGALGKTCLFRGSYTFACDGPTAEMNGTFAGNGSRVDIILATQPSITFSGNVITADEARMTSYRLGMGPVKTFDGTASLTGHGATLAVLPTNGPPFAICAIPAGCIPPQSCLFDEYLGFYRQVISGTQPVPDEFLSVVPAYPPLTPRAQP